MKNRDSRDIWVDEVMSSLSGIEKPAANPFLYEKIRHRMAAGSQAAIARRPGPLVGWAIAILLVIAANGFSIINKIKQEKHISLKPYVSLC